MILGALPSLKFIYGLGFGIRAHSHLLLIVRAGGGIGRESSLDQPADCLGAATESWLKEEGAKMWWNVTAGAAEEFYEAKTAAEARGLFARNAGFRSEAAMCETLGQASKIVAEPAKVEVGGQMVDFERALRCADPDLLEEVHAATLNFAERHGIPAPNVQRFISSYADAHRAKFGEQFVVN